MRFSGIWLHIKLSARRFFRRIVGLYVVCSLLVFVVAFFIAATPVGRWLENEQRVGCTTFDNLRDADAIVVLGGDEGSRSIAAMKAYRAGKAPVIIISSDEDRISDSLRAGGIPDDAILIDTRPRRTIEHPYTILQLPGVTTETSLIVTSSRLQERRAKYLFERAGYNDVQVYSYENDFEIFKSEHPDKYPDDGSRSQRLRDVCYAYAAWVKFLIVDYLF